MTLENKLEKIENEIAAKRKSMSSFGKISPFRLLMFLPFYFIYFCAVDYKLHRLYNKRHRIANKVQKLMFEKAK